MATVGAAASPKKAVIMVPSQSSTSDQFDMQFASHIAASFLSIKSNGPRIILASRLTLERGCGGMAKRSVVRGAKSEPELIPDAWARFERAVDVVAKSPPQHRTKKKKSPRKRRR